MKALDLLRRYNEGKKDLVFDIRSKEKYDTYHMPHATHADKNVFAHNEEDFIKDKKQTVYIVCNSGNSSGVLTLILKSKGYDVISVEGGMNPLMDKLGLETVACLPK